MDALRGLRRSVRPMAGDSRAHVATLTFLACPRYRQDTGLAQVGDGIAVAESAR